MIKIVKTLINDNRKVVETLFEGSTKYKVLFTQIYRYDISLFGKVIKTYNRIKENLDYVIFSDILMAEWYAKNTKKICRETIYDQYQNYNYIISFDHIIYLIGDEAISKYGYFYLYRKDGASNKYGPVTLNDFCISFYFNSRYEKKYCTHINITDNSINADNMDEYTADKCIKYVLDKCNNFEKTGKVINDFDIVTIESLPIDKINASSKEINELKAIVNQYQEIQKEYIEVTKKLLVK